MNRKINLVKIMLERKNYNCKKLEKDYAKEKRLKKVFYYYFLQLLCNYLQIYWKTYQNNYLKCSCYLYTIDNKYFFLDLYFSLNYSSLKVLAIYNNKFLNLNY